MQPKISTRDIFTFIIIFSVISVLSMFSTISIALGFTYIPRETPCNILNLEINVNSTNTCEFICYPKPPSSCISFCNYVNYTVEWDAGNSEKKCSESQVVFFETYEEALNYYNNFHRLKCYKTPFTDEKCSKFNNTIHQTSFIMYFFGIGILFCIVDFIFICFLSYIILCKNKDYDMYDNVNII